MDFNSVIKNGVKYLSRKEETEVRRSMIARDENTFRRSIPIDAANQPLVDLCLSRVKEWLATPESSRPTYLNIPGPDNNTFEYLSNFQRRIIHQTVQSHQPDLKTQSIGNFVQVRKPSNADLEKENQRQETAREQRITDAIGFRWIMEALFAGDITNLPSDYVFNNLQMLPEGVQPYDYVKTLQAKLKLKKRVLVGHNCFNDFIYLYQCFIGDLPNTVEEFKAELSSLAPMIVDTKFLASAIFNDGKFTSLDRAEAYTRRFLLPELETGTGFDKYAGSARLHEAGYDSLLTADLVVKMAAHLAVDRKELVEKVKEKFAAPAPAKDDDLATPRGPTFEATTATSGGGVNDPAADSDSESGYESAAESLMERLERKFLDAFVAESRAASPEKAAAAPAPAEGNPFAALEMDAEGPEGPEGEKERVDEEVKVKKIEEMARGKELMPGWEGEFWAVFGNKLVVNGAVEGVCCLK
jgi:poly(A)-specific ribonuclease